MIFGELLVSGSGTLGILFGNGASPFTTGFFFRNFDLQRYDQHGSEPILWFPWDKLIDQYGVGELAWRFLGWNFSVSQPELPMDTLRKNFRSSLKAGHSLLFCLDWGVGFWWKGKNTNRTRGGVPPWRNELNEPMGFPVGRWGIETWTRSWEWRSNRRRLEPQRPFRRDF